MKEAKRRVRISSREKTSEDMGVDGRIIEKCVNLGLLKKCSVTM
jgi:hypothetical protein